MPKEAEGGFHDWSSCDQIVEVDARTCGLVTDIVTPVLGSSLSTFHLSSPRSFCPSPWPWRPRHCMSTLSLILMSSMWHICMLSLTCFLIFLHLQYPTGGSLRGDREAMFPSFPSFLQDLSRTKNKADWLHYPTPHSFSLKASFFFK